MTHSTRNSGACNTCHQTSCCCPPSDCLNEATALNVYQSQLDQLTSALFGKISEKDLVIEEIRELTAEFTPASAEVASKEATYLARQEELANRRQEWLERLKCCREMAAKIDALQLGLHRSADTAKAELAKAKEMLAALESELAALTLQIAALCPDEDGDGEPDLDTCLGDTTTNIDAVKTAVQGFHDLIEAAEAILNSINDTQLGSHAHEALAETAVADATGIHAAAVGERVLSEQFNDVLEALQTWVIGHSLTNAAGFEAFLQQTFTYPDANDPQQSGLPYVEAVDGDGGTRSDADATEATGLQDNVAELIASELTTADCVITAGKVTEVLVHWHNTLPAATLSGTAQSIATENEMDIRQEWDANFTANILDLVPLDTAVANALAALESARADLEASTAARVAQEASIASNADLINAAVQALDANDTCGSLDAWYCYVALSRTKASIALLKGRIGILQNILKTLERSIAEASRYSESCCDGECVCEPCDDKGKVPGRITMTWSPYTGAEGTVIQKLLNFFNNVVYIDPSTDSDGSSRRVDGNDMFQGPLANGYVLSEKGNFLAASVIRNRLCIGINKHALVDYLNALDAARDGDGSISYDNETDRENFMYAVYQVLQGMRTEHSQIFATEAAERVANIKADAEALASLLPAGGTIEDVLSPNYGDPDQAALDKAAAEAQAAAVAQVEGARLISANASGKQFGLVGMDIVIVEPATSPNYAAAFWSAGLAGYFPGAPLHNPDDNVSTVANNWLFKRTFSKQSVHGWAGILGGNFTSKTQADVELWLDQEVPYCNDVGPVERDESAVVPVGSVTVQVADAQAAFTAKALDFIHKFNDQTATEPDLNPQNPESYLNKSVYIAKPAAALTDFKVASPALYNLLFVDSINLAEDLTGVWSINAEAIAAYIFTKPALTGGIGFRRFFWPRAAIMTNALFGDGSNSSGIVRTADRFISLGFLHGINFPHVHYGRSLNSPDHSDGVVKGLVFGRRANAGNNVIMPKSIGPSPYAAWLCWEKARVLAQAELLGLITGLGQRLDYIKLRIEDLNNRICGGHADSCDPTQAEAGLKVEIETLEQQRKVVAAMVRTMALAIANCGRDDHPAMPSASIDSMAAMVQSHQSLATAQVQTQLAQLTADMASLTEESTAAEGNYNIQVATLQEQIAALEADLAAALEG